jgi:hypothetical protein
VTFDRLIGIVGGGLSAVRLRVDSLEQTTWSPDASALSYVFGIAPDECSYPRPGLGLVAPGHRPRVLIKPGGSEIRSTAWSPDGRTLAVDLAPDYDAQAEQRGRRHHWPRRIARDYGMFSRRGNAAMRRIVVRAGRALRHGAGREQTLRLVRKAFERAASRYREADDTAVRDALADELDKWLTAAGLAPIEAFDEITC